MLAGSVSGYLVLAPGEGIEPSAREITNALEGAGFSRFDGNGMPAFVVFHTAGPKGDYFEAGFWGGCNVPVFFLGGGARAYSRKQIVNRFGGWTVVGNNGHSKISELICAISRRGIKPEATNEAPVAEHKYEDH